MSFNDLSIVIVTYKSESKIFDCLNSIKIKSKVFVIENSNSQNLKSKLKKIIKM